MIKIFIVVFCSYDFSIECALHSSLRKHSDSEMLKDDEGHLIIDKLVDLFPSKCYTECFGYDGYYICRGTNCITIYLFIYVPIYS